MLEKVTSHDIGRFLKKSNGALFIFEERWVLLGNHKCFAEDAIHMFFIIKGHILTTASELGDQIEN